MKRTVKLSALRRANRLLRDSLKRCAICPRRCGTDRTAGRRGYCRASRDIRLYSYSRHHGEEPPLSGRSGSGTIFFSRCNMKCIYCQNYYFSQLDNGEGISPLKLAEVMLQLQKEGCHNINLVSPTHYVPQILLALEAAIENGLELPILYNSGGYDLPETIRILDGIIDIYMPDMRYSDNAQAEKYSDAPDYVEYNRASVIEMQRQVGDLMLDKNGIAERGLIIRLLVLPHDISGTVPTLEFIRKRISRNAYLSIMSQYYPAFKACGDERLARGIGCEEYKNVIDAAAKLGLNNGWIQEGPAGFDPSFRGTNIRPKPGIGP